MLESFPRIDAMVGHTMHFMGMSIQRRQAYVPKLRRNRENLSSLKSDYENPIRNCKRSHESSFKELMMQMAKCALTEDKTDKKLEKTFVNTIPMESQAHKRIRKEHAEDLLSEMFGVDDLDFSVAVTSVLETSYNNVHNYIERKQHGSFQEDDYFQADLKLMDSEVLSFLLNWANYFLCFIL